MRPSQHSRRHSLSHVPTFSLGEDIDLAIGLTAGALAGNEFMESSQSHRASHLLKAGLGAVVAAGAFKMLGREHREKDRHSRHHHDDRLEDEDDSHHSDGHHGHHDHHHQREREESEDERRGHTHQRRAHHGDRIGDGDEHHHRHRHHHHPHHHHHHHDRDYNDDSASLSSRSHRRYILDADEDQPYRRHSFESDPSRHLNSERNYRGRDFGYRDRDLRHGSSNSHGASKAGSRRSSPLHPDRSAAAGQNHHVHFSPTVDIDD